MLNLDYFIQKMTLCGRIRARARASARGFFPRPPARVFIFRARGKKIRARGKKIRARGKKIRARGKKSARAEINPRARKLIRARGKQDGKSKNAIKNLLKKFFPLKWKFFP